MSDVCQNMATQEKKQLIREKEVYQQIANLLVREELISRDEKLRFLSALRKDGVGKC